MLSILAALQVLVLAQAAEPPRLVTPEEAVGNDAAVATTIAQGGTAAPAQGGTAASAQGGTAAAAAPAQGKTAARPAATPERPRIPSLLSAEPLGGASAAFAWAGWSSLGIAYALGVTPIDDLGGFIDLDWATTEWRLGALYRRPFGQSGSWDLAGRISLAWYANSGSSWAYAGNHYDRGLEIAPALLISKRAGTGVLSFSAEFPMIITVHYGGGFLFLPKATASYELPLIEAVTVGARAAIGYRAGSGSAPLATGRGEFEFLVLASYLIL
jgi:hypothetical protein